MRYHLEYGRTGLDVDLPESNVVKCLGYRPAEPLADPQAALCRLLARPMGTPSLAELAKAPRDACILISDVTRPVPNALILPPLLATLEHGGIPRKQITILVATGLHRPNVGDELVEMVGREVAGNYRVVNHHGKERAEHSYLGKSPRGVPIWIDSRYVQGRSEDHHRPDRAALHGRILRRAEADLPGHRRPGNDQGLARSRFPRTPAARSGCLEHNPVHEENTWIARRAGCDFIVNTVIDSQRRVLKLVAGDMEAAFQEGVEFVRSLVVDTVPEPVDIVVTCSAGYPLDTTFYQSVKGMVAAVAIVKPGGTIMMAASMTEGIGSVEFRKIFHDHPTLEGFMERILGKKYFVPDQWQLEELAKARRKAKIIAVTDGLPPATLNRLFVEQAAERRAGRGRSPGRVRPAGHDRRDSQRAVRDGRGGCVERRRLGGHAQNEVMGVG